MSTKTRVQSAILVTTLVLGAGGMASAMAAVTPAPSAPAATTTLATTPAEHTTEAGVERQHAAHHTAMAKHHRSKCDEYRKKGQTALAEKHCSMQKHHENLAGDHAAAAKIHDESKTPNKP